jgi:hypothetical protein
MDARRRQRDHADVDPGAIHLQPRRQIHVPVGDHVEVAGE